MTTPTSISASATRTALLELHRRLLQAQRIQAERYGGRMSASELLQASTRDPRFSWLTQLSELLAALDQARADADAEGSEAVLAKVRGLITAPDPGSAFGRRYLQLLQDHPEVVFAHRDAIATLHA
jgi:hypothetical protein